LGVLGITSTPKTRINYILILRIKSEKLEKIAAAIEKKYKGRTINIYRKFGSKTP